MSRTPPLENSFSEHDYPGKWVCGSRKQTRILEVMHTMLNSNICSCQAINSAKRHMNLFSQPTNRRRDQVL